MIEMTSERWRLTCDYLADVFGEEDEILRNLSIEAEKCGLPAISVGPEVGRLMMILTSMTRAERVLEIGTLGGYSAIWLARGMKPAGKLITIEPEKLHADFAEEQFKRAKLNDRIQLRRAKALDILPDLSKELGPNSLDVIFLDAIKAEYPEYWKFLRPMLAVGGLVLADNVFGAGDWSIVDSDHPSWKGVDAFSRLIASDRDFEVSAVPLREGLMIGKRMK